MSGDYTATTTTQRGTHSVISKPARFSYPITPCSSPSALAVALAGGTRGAGIGSPYTVSSRLS